LLSKKHQGFKNIRGFILAVPNEPEWLAQAPAYRPWIKYRFVFLSGFYLMHCLEYGIFLLGLDG
jgi:hypothetical protein